MTVFVRRVIVSTAAAWLVSLGAAPAEAHVVGIRVDHTEPFADGATFGAAAALVKARLLLPEDAERIRASARRSDPLAP